MSFLNRLAIASFLSQSAKLFQVSPFFKTCNMKNTIGLLVALILIFKSYGQHKTENIIIITLDGFRWQEVFNGADSLLIKNEKYSENQKELVKEFWSDQLEERRKKLLPFFWSTIVKDGQLYGNRILGNYVDVSNRYRFSYPGYNEIFTGYPDTAVNSNDKNPNKNENVLEFLNKQAGYQNSVAAFSSWDVFPFILNEERSKIYVNSGIEEIREKGIQFELLNGLQETTYRMLGENVRPDLLTFFSAKEYLKQKQPKVLYIAFDETDDFAHGGKYDLYLKAARMEDKMIGDLWDFVQHQPSYKGKTTFIITTDHGRGDKIKDQWRDHGQKVEEASQIWLAVIGPDTAPLGEIKKQEQLYQRQIATTIANLLGFDFHPSHPTQAGISTVSRR